MNVGDLPPQGLNNGTKTLGKALRNARWVSFYLTGQGSMQNHAKGVGASPSGTGKSPDPMDLPNPSPSDKTVRRSTGPGNWRNQNALAYANNPMF